tara:strand:- start:24674 stop:25606 length:933 start_codon:yes stop_codon:yes gene_type:complete
MNKVATRISQVSLTIIVTWFILNRVGIDLATLKALEPADWKPNFFILTLSCVLLLVGYFFSAALWGKIVHDLGGPTLPALTSVRLFMVANLGRYVPGKVWQILGLTYLAKKEGVSGSVAIGAAILGQLTSLLAASLIGISTLWYLADWRQLKLASLIAGIIILVTLTSIITIPSIFRRIIILWTRLTRTEFPDNLKRQNNISIRWLALYIINWCIYTTAFWLLYLSFGEWRTFIEIGPAFAAACVIGYLAIFAPAGAGIREGFLVVLLQHAMSAEIALVLAVVSRLWTTAIEMILATICGAKYIQFKKTV